MLTIYTAIGNLKIKKDQQNRPYPIISNQGKEHMLDPQETILWFSLAFQILTFGETKNAYEQKVEGLAPMPSHSFEHYLRRLLFRGLIAKGDGLTGLDALYELLGNLYIVPLADSFHVRLFSSIHLLLKGDISIGDFKLYMKRPEESQTDRTILRLARAAAMSTAELLQCMELGKTELRNTEDLVQALYADEDTTCEGLKERVHSLHTQPPALSSIGNLYLNKRISFITL